MPKTNKLTNLTKKWLAIGARTFLFALPFLTTVVARAAETVPSTSCTLAGPLGTLGNVLCGFGITAIFRSLMGIVIFVIGGILSLLYSFFQSVVNNGLLNGQDHLILSGPIKDAWGIMLGAANILLFLALTIMAILVITGSQNYNVKKALSGLIYAVLVANLSYEVVKLIVGLGDTLKDGIVASFTALGASQNPFTRWQDSLDLLFSFESSGAINSFKDIGRSLMIGFVTIGTLAVGTYAMLKLGLILIERAIRISLAIVLAPLVFVLQLFPGVGLEGLAKTWWSDLVKWTLVYPVVYLMLSIAGLLMANQFDSTNAGFTDKIIAAVDSTGGTATTTLPTNFWGDFMLSIAAIAITLAAANAPQYLQLKAVSGDFFKPIDNLLKGGHNLAKDLTGTGLKTLGNKLAPNINPADSRALKVGKTLFGGLAKGIQKASDLSAKGRLNLKDSKEAVAKEQDKRLAESSSAIAEKLSGQIDIKIMDALGASAPASIEELRNLDNYNKLRTQAIKDNPGLGKAYLAARKQSVGLIDTRVEENFKGNVSINTLGDNVKKGIDEGNLSDIEVGVRSLEKYLRNGTDDEKRDAANMIRQIAATGNNASIIRSAIADFRLPAQPSAPNRITTDDLMDLAKINEKVAVDKSNLRTQRTVVETTDPTLISLLDEVDNETLNQVIINPSTDLATALDDPATRTAERDIATLLTGIKGLTVQKQDELNKSIAEARLADPSVRDSKIRAALNATGARIPAGAVSAFAKITGLGVATNDVNNAIKLRRDALASSASQADIKDYAQKSVVQNQSIQQAKRLENELSNRSSNSRGVVLTTLNRNEHSAALQTLQDFDSNYSKAVLEINNEIARLQSTNRADADELEDKLRNQNLADVAATLPAATSGITTAEIDRLRDQISTLAGVNHNFISPGALNQTQALTQATAQNLSTVAYALRYRNEGK